MGGRWLFWDTFGKIALFLFVQLEERDTMTKSWEQYQRWLQEPQKLERAEESYHMPSARTNQPMKQHDNTHAAILAQAVVAHSAYRVPRCLRLLLPVRSLARIVRLRRTLT